MLTKLSKVFFSPQVTTRIRFFLDECLPPVLRDQRWFYVPILKIWHGKRDLDFKQHVLLMTNEQFQDCYEKLLPRRRSSDMTPRTTEFVLTHLVGERILEVGCGDAEVSLACAKQGYEVLATDIAPGNFKDVFQNRESEFSGTIDYDVADVEKLPFPDNSFDVTLCLHTLEHVRDLYAAIHEIKRVTRQRVIAIMPRQRYYRYTCDYHLHFFWNPEQLMLAMNLRKSSCAIIDRSLCYIGDIDESS